MPQQDLGNYSSLCIPAASQTGDLSDPPDQAFQLQGGPFSVMTHGVSRFTESTRIGMAQHVYISIYL